MKPRDLEQARLEGRIDRISDENEEQQDSLDKHERRLDELQENLNNYVPRVGNLENDTKYFVRRIGQLQAAVDDLNRWRRRAKWSLVVDLALWITLLALLVANSSI